MCRRLTSPESSWKSFGASLQDLYTVHAIRETVIMSPMLEPKLILMAGDDGSDGVFGGSIGRMRDNLEKVERLKAGYQPHIVLRNDEARYLLYLV